MKIKLLIGIILGALGVIMGAFGAHSLKPLISPESLNSYHTAVSYQFYHVMAIILAYLLYQHKPSKYISFAASSFIIGIILFSGSLYILSTKAVTGFENMAIIGPLTPVGGLFYIIGWSCLFVGILRSQK